LRLEVEVLSSPAQGKHKQAGGTSKLGAIDIKARAAVIGPWCAAWLWI